ncbi:hypothetical protein O6P43_009571 [Quillaja saponaria]|uniref:Uncharacterized protein n=1 Tax=Quillaja saponaria TaxID=32244 RepID=A0AAD7VDC0_QUISA|nr:hypothetical protein O6P43_009571 [Quillaja saponaria]
MVQVCPHKRGIRIGPNALKPTSVMDVQDADHVFRVNWKHIAITSTKLILLSSKFSHSSPFHLLLKVRRCELEKSLNGTSIIV